MNRVLFTILLVFPCLLVCSTSYGQKDMPTEYDVKAAFLYNFTNFVKWPDNSFADENSPFIIGVYGKNPFNGKLTGIVEGEKVEEIRLIMVRQINTMEELTECHIVFTATSQKKTLDRIFAKLEGKAVLTVGKAKDFTRRSGMIGFVNDKNRIQFEMNVREAEKVDLRINSRLQRVAKKIIK